MGDLSRSLVVIVFSVQALAGARHMPAVAIQVGENQQNLILSRIMFDDNEKPIIRYADVSEADPLSVCPLEEMPLSIKTATTQLVSKMADAVSKIKDARGQKCSKLQDRIDATATQLGTAMQYQFIAARAIPSTADQNAINAQTRQASAVNTLLLTASDMFHRDCINTIDEKVVIQKLVGQVVTLSGLFMGGWQGLSIAAGGQLIGNLPLFRDDVDKALELLQKYQEKEARGSFLCMYRQMQKMSVLLFANSDNKVLSGLDLSFSTGAVKTTIDSMATIQKESPDLLLDVSMLREIYVHSEPLVQDLTESDAIRASVFPLFGKVKNWCHNVDVGLLKAPEQHLERGREELARALGSLHGICEAMNAFNWKVHTEPQMSDLLLEVYWNLSTIRGYYSRLLDDDVSGLGKIVKTNESMRYFEELKKSMEDYRSSSGNQVRLNYESLTRRLGDDIAKKTFISLMKQNHVFLTQHTFFTRRRIHDMPVRQRALTAMLDLCMTLDPTLTRLYIDAPLQHRLQTAWISQCAGPKSRLCRDVFGAKDQSSLLYDVRYRAYFYSLCGRIIF
jgi:hypothetical protein